MFLKGYRNTVPVPRHWCQKRKFLQVNLTAPKTYNIRVGTDVPCGLELIEDVQRAQRALVWVVVRKEVYRRRASIASYLVHVVSAGCGSSSCLNNGRKTGMWVAVEESPPVISAFLCQLYSRLFCYRSPAVLCFQATDVCSWMGCICLIVCVVVLETFRKLGKSCTHQY